jgi:hypothetical protein
VGFLLLAACSFDPSNRLAGTTSDAGAAADAAASADANPQPTPDAGQSDGNSNLTAGTLTSTPLDGAITLDGELDAQWEALTFRIHDIDDSEQMEAIDGYEPDASVRFASLYSDEKIYFFFQVFDDLLIDDSSDIYNDDSIEIYIDGLNDSSGPYSNDDHWLLIGASGTYQSFGPSSIVPSGSIVTTDVGYNIELALDRTDIGSGMAPEMGFNIAINDDDDEGGSAVDAYGLWFMPDEESTCTDCCSGQDEDYAWCDTTRLGRLLLLP